MLFSANIHIFSLFFLAYFAATIEGHGAREISNFPDIFCIKPLLTNCLVCHILPCFIAFKIVTYIPMSAEGHLGSKELICQFSRFQWVKYYFALIIVVYEDFHIFIKLSAAHGGITCDVYVTSRVTSSCR